VVVRAVSASRLGRPSGAAQTTWLGPDQRADALVVFGATGDLAYKKSTWILGMNTLSTSLLGAATTKWSVPH